MSSGMTSVGCVSLRWMKTLFGRSVHVSLDWRKRRRMSRTEQATKKYCWRRRSSLPAIVLSFG